MRTLLGLAMLAVGCSPAPLPEEDGGAIDAEIDERDARMAEVDAPSFDAGALPDTGPAPTTLAGHRDRLWATLGADACGGWAAIDASRRAVFLTITHRLFTSHGPDGLPILAHVTRVYRVLGGGSSGTTCGGASNNRLFLQIDDTLHGWLVETWNETATPIADDGGSTWIHTRDAAGPHDPFDASAETDTGLRCTLLFEESDSEPPTAQAHYFVGDAQPVERGAGISLPADPRMLEIDQDFDCVHDSNPTCRDFEARYVTHHGDFECEWVPSTCTAVGSGCYRSAS